MKEKSVLNKSTAQTANYIRFFCLRKCQQNIQYLSFNFLFFFAFCVKTAFIFISIYQVNNFSQLSRFSNVYIPFFFSFMSETSWNIFLYRNVSKLRLYESFRNLLFTALFVLI